MNSKYFYRKQSELLEQRAPPIATAGIIGWLRKNLFSSPLNSVLTLICIYILWVIINDFIVWAYIDASFVGDDRLSCTTKGACWAWVDQRIGQFLYGFYPIDQRWRVNLTLILLIPAIAFILFEKIPGAKYGKWFSLLFPFIASIILVGGFGLEEIPINNQLFDVYHSPEVKKHIENEGKYQGCEGCEINCYMQPSFAVEMNKYWWKALPSTLKYNKLKGTWKNIF